MKNKKEKAEANVFFLNHVEAVTLKEQHRNLKMNFTVNKISPRIKSTTLVMAQTTLALSLELT